jgi:hypothetical protein
MKRLCGLVAASAFLFTGFVASASAEPSGPLSALEAICLQQGGTWYPYEVPFVGDVVCYDVGIAVYQVPGSYESSQILAVDRLCKAAGFTGVATFGKGIPGPGFFVVTWACA